eukprot:TRINITY_DN28921_c0_g1_i3.p1 TRINITY_DN28921_c0_g1~~TRINITY_DN28921_c0_g1_i3.p1  ORF type:complete len:873 (-),score=171.82 TRINITY_DN28921_c0_g1_i3:143-2761(-)
MRAVAQCLALSLSLLLQASAQGLLEVVDAQDDLRLFSGALRGTGLAASLEAKPESSTLFAPTDSALRRLMSNWGLTERTLSDSTEQHRVGCLLQYASMPTAIDKEVLASQLPSYGVYSAGHRSAAVPSLCDYTCAPGPSCWRALILHADEHGNGNLLAGGGVVRKANIYWRKGIIHVIDAVPHPTFWAPVAARDLKSVLSRPGLSLLWGAVRGTQLDVALQERAEYGTKYTFFAPTDDALRRYLASVGMSETKFISGGDYSRRTDYLLRSLLSRGFGDESDLWRAAAARGGQAAMGTLCPCGGTLMVTASGSSGARSLRIHNGNLVKADQMWLGGLVHIIDTMPYAPCWAQGAVAPSPPPPPALPAPAPAAAAPTAVSVTYPPVSPPAPAPPHYPSATFGSCHPSLERTLKNSLSSGAGIALQVFEYMGLVDTLESWHNRVAVFMPTDIAMKAFMNEYGLTIDDFIMQGWMADTCVHQLLNGLVSATEETAGKLKRWASPNNGQFELPTLCGKKCSEGLQVALSESGNLRINGGRVIVADLQWCNGLLHVIDKMPVPADWAYDTHDCRKPKKQVTAAEDGEPQYTAALKIGYLPKPPQNDLPVQLDWDTVNLIVIVLAAFFVGVALVVGSIVCLIRCKRRVSKVKPEQALDVLKKPKVVEGMVVDPKKTAEFMNMKKLSLEDLEKQAGFESWNDNGSEPSTRCPSSRSLSTASVASSRSSFSHQLPMSRSSTNGFAPISRSGSNTAIQQHGFSPGFHLALRETAAQPQLPTPPSAGRTQQPPPPFADFGRSGRSRSLSGRDSEGHGNASRDMRRSRSAVDQQSRRSSERHASGRRGQAPSHGGRRSSRASQRGAPLSVVQERPDLERVGRGR